MRGIFDGVLHDEDGRMILGDPYRGCGYCEADAVPTYSACGKVVWWHSPTDCCPARVARVRGATKVGADDYADAREAVYRGGS